MNENGYKLLSAAVIESALNDLIPDDHVEEIERLAEFTSNSPESAWQRMAIRKALARNESARHFFERRRYKLWSILLELGDEEIEELYLEVIG